MRAPRTPRPAGTAALVVCRLPHPIQPRPQSIPALSASNLCSEPVPPRASEILCLPSPPRLPLPRMGFVTGRSGDGFFLQPGLRGRGHRAAFGNRGGGLLGEITALGNRDDALAQGRPLPLPAQVTPFRDASWEVESANAGSGGELEQPGHKSQDSTRPEEVAEGPIPASVVPAVLPLSRGSRRPALPS